MFIKLLRRTVFILLTVQFVFATNWPFLDTERMGAANFIKHHPNYNGKEVVVFILDTGVDMGVPGLTTLPDGSVKVIDVQDFSGEGDVPFTKAEEDSENGEAVIKTSAVKLFGYKALASQPQDSIFYLGVLDEERFKNSVIPDINNNGRMDEHFGVLVMHTNSGWLAYVDLDGDGNIDDEQPLYDYKEKLQSFQFRGRDTKTERNLATFGLNILPDEKKVSFHFDGSSHGTHVAGITAGYRINGQEGLNGIAPGAKIISLKIGNGQLAGGATVTGSMIKAYEYGIKFAKSYDGPVVFNMSFGIGSEIEGRSVMDLTLNDFLRENERLLFCVSAGNEGPGISTVGLPAAASRVLTVGALNTKFTANNLYGAHLSLDKLFVFSSRGGELNKPDIVTPGGASSTVPPFSTRDVKWGTSMASPQATGAVALIMSAAYQQNPPLAINGALIKKAIKNTAENLPGYLPLEQGSGVINIPKAFQLYKKWMTAEKKEMVADYDITTESPIYPTEDGPAAYWRFGNYAPDKNHKQRFYINPLFSKKTDADAKNNFYRAFTLKSTANWLKLNSHSIYIKGEGPAYVDVYFDKQKMKRPGLYNAKVLAYRNGGWFSGNSAENKEFELMCTYVKPVPLNEQNGFRWDSGVLTIKRGDVKRVFFDVPAKASSGSITLTIPSGAFANVRAYLYDPAGREKHASAIRSERYEKGLIQIKTDELEPGTWELDLYADFRNEQPSKCKAVLAFSGLTVHPDVVSDIHYRNGSDASGQFNVINNFDELVECSLSGSVMGIQRKDHIEDDSDHYEYDFSVSKACERVSFELELTPDVFNLFTDFAVNIKNYSGKVQYASGFSYRTLTINFTPERAGDYILEFIPGFARHEAQDWGVTITEKQYYFKNFPVQKDHLSFYPHVEKTVNFVISGQLPVAPDDYTLFGEIWLDSRGSYVNRTIIPLQLFTGLH